MRLEIKIIAVLLALSSRITIAQSPDAALEKLSSDARDWVNRSCPRSLGPSLWSSCVSRESEAAKRGKPDLSNLEPDFQTWITNSCPDLLGPSLTISCIAREKAALQKGLPDTSFLTEDQNQWLSNSCPALLGPSLYVSCVKKESAALRGSKSPQKRPNTIAVPKQPNIDDYQAPLKDQNKVEQLEPEEKQEFSIENQSRSWGCASAIETRIDGTFQGWEGETIFKLTNGQIWQQSSYAYTYHYAYRPEVIIYSARAGCKMKVDGVGDSIFVKRLK